MNMTPTLEKPETSEQDGSFYAYPSHKIVSVFAQTEDLRDALDAHRENGVKESEIEVISSTEQIDFSGEENGSWARIVRTVQQLGSEGRYLDRYKQELKDGHFLLTVVAKNAETKKKVKEMLQSNGGLRLTFFGNWLIEEIPEAPKIEFDTHPYGYRREVKKPFEETLKHAREALQMEGFGVLSEIDMKAKLKQKLGVDFRDYVILGACDLPLAHSALQEDLDIGLLLPCNVVVYGSNSGSVVAAIDAKKMMAVTGNRNLETTAEAVNQKLRRVIESL